MASMSVAGAPSRSARNNLLFENLKGLRRRDALSISLVWLALLSLNVAPVNRVAGLPLAGLAGLAAAFNPYALLLYLSGSQVSADPAGSPFTLAQIGLAGWIIALPLNGGLRHLDVTWQMLKYVLPYLVWSLGVHLINQTFGVDLLFAVISGLVACVCVAQTGRRYQLCLLMLTLGTGIALIGYWGRLLGLDILGVSQQFLQFQPRGGQQLGVGRADDNFVAISLGFFTWTAVSLALYWACQHWKQKLGWTGYFLVGLCVVATVPPIAATFSRGALAYLVGGALLTIILVVVVPNLAPVRHIVLFVALPIGLLLSALGSGFILDTGAARNISSLLQFSNAQAARTQQPSLFVDRLGIWSIHWNLMVSHPLFGVAKGDYVDLGGYGSGYVGDPRLNAGVAHNVFLGEGSSTGIPGALFVMMTFFLPILLLVRRRGLFFSMPFLTGYFIVLLVFLNLSVGNWKTYWALFAIVALAANEGIGSSDKHRGDQPTLSSGSAVGTG